MKNRNFLSMVLIPAALCMSLWGCEKEECCCKDSSASQAEHIVLKQDTLFVHTIDEDGKTIHVTKFINYQSKESSKQKAEDVLP